MNLPTLLIAAALVVPGEPANPGRPGPKPPYPEHKPPVVLVWACKIGMRPACRLLVEREPR